MKKTKRLGVLAGLSCFATALALLPVSNAIAEEQLEEVIVTGSYIKRDSFDSSSPLTVIDQASIVANATPNLGEILADQTFNYGSDFQTNTYAARSQGGNSTSANLRGLGAGATLQLIDGLRTINGNLTNALPQIAIERIDILKDGASALYGSDAVAGVVNIITRKNFNGVKFSGFYTQDKDNDHHENLFDFIAGADTDNGHITIAAAVRRRTELTQPERPEFLRNGFERSGTGNPGDWLVPTRDATGAISGASRLTDPGCGVENGPGGTDVGAHSNFLTGDKSGGNCGLHFGEFWNFINPIDQESLWVNYRYDFNENISNELDIIVSRMLTTSRGSPQNPGGRTEEFPIVLGDHPGNPFRAFSDLNSNGAIDAGEHLFAQDANGDGIPDRGNLDMNGDGIMDVILAADPFDSSQGIPFNEDVDVLALRIFGKIGLLEGANQPTALNADGSNSGNWSFENWDIRITDTLTVAIPDTSWEVMARGIYERNPLVYSDKNTSQSKLVQGLQGELKALPTDPGTSYWNPFSTQALNCIDRVCTHTGTPDFANTVDVLDAVNLSTTDVTDVEFYYFDLIATGDLLDLPAGTLAGAVGLAYSKVQQNVDINAAENACDWHQGGCSFDYRAKQDVNSAFFELVVPALENLEIQVAGGYVDYGGSIGDSFDPKIGLLWRPLEILSVRASWSSAFIAPTLEDRFEPEDCALQTASDPVLEDFSQSFRVACIAGNTSLVPETADVWNVGFSLALLDGDLNLGLDYASYDFKDRVADTTMNQVLNLDFNNYVAAGFTPGDVSDVLAWVADPRSDPNIRRDITGVITRVTTSRLNAQKMTHKAYDIYANYHLGTNGWGDYRFSITATFVDEFSFDLGLGIPPGDGAGQQNEDIVEIPPIPEWRVVGIVNWNMGNHAAMLKLRWTDKWDLDFNSKALQGGQLFFNKTLVMDDILYTDVNYSYTFTDLFGGDRETTVEIGGRNVFDEFPDPIFNLGGIETYVHDIRGRTWYVRINQDI
ncbi:MAG: TonB-dependent receptor [Gammaproteobacteria bacterium]|nr:TonB-dependent receptor [Gammaproteobacteria bacterium]